MEMFLLQNNIGCPLFERVRVACEEAKDADGLHAQVGDAGAGLRAGLHCRGRGRGRGRGEAGRGGAQRGVCLLRAGGRPRHLRPRHHGGGHGGGQTGRLAPLCCEAVTGRMFE